MKHLLRLACLLACLVASANEPSTILDSVTFGDPKSERRHDLSARRSDTVTGGLGLPARRLLPLERQSWDGGRVMFTMRVDPAKPNYATLRLWGSDASANRLILLCEGKQIGYRHLGDIDVLDSPNESPALNGRFFYTTTPLPVELTRGKKQVDFEIRATGRIWGYGQTFDKYQKPMTDPTRGLYRIYTHTDGCFVPPADEKQGEAPVNPPVRPAPGPEVLDQLKERVSREITGMLAGTKPLNQHQLWLLARAYHVKWTPAYHNEELAKKAVVALDDLYAAYQKDPKIAQSGPAIYNSDWFGVGPAAAAVVLLAEPLQPFLNNERRTGWAEMFVACRDHHREHRRQYTNQSMISDTYGLYFPNRAVAVLDPKKALPESHALRYLYESAGLQPWLGSENNGVPEKPLGDNYLQLTDKGLTKELGFVGYYGEVLDWMTAMYDASRDAKLKAQLVKAARARAAFRYPALDNDGNRAMRAEAVVGWRDQDHYPGDILYAQRPSWDGTAVEAVAATLDPVLVGYAQQMLADNQFFATVEGALKGTGLRVTAGLLDIPDAYETLKAQPASSHRLPMAGPDFVFSDEEDGVVAIKNGNEILYVSLYWRARNAINFLARVHYVTPRFDRIAVVRQETVFEPSGEFYTRPDWINMGFGNGGVKYPGNLHSAHAGEKLPIAKVPDGIAFKPGAENVYAGKGEFYTLRYGPYLIDMNTTKNKTFELRAPEGAKELTTGHTGNVGPRSTVVFYLREAAGESTAFVEPAGELVGTAPKEEEIVAPPPEPATPVSIPALDALRENADWLRANGEAVNGALVIAFPRQLPWGLCTQKPGKLYLIALHWPKAGNFEVPILNDVTHAYLLSAPGNALVVGSHGNAVEITGPPSAPEGSVVVLDVDGDVEMAPVPQVRQQPDRTIRLAADAAEFLDADPDERTSDRLRWKVRVIKPGRYLATLTYETDPESEDTGFTLKAGDQPALASEPGKPRAEKTVALGVVRLDRGGMQTFVIEPREPSRPAIMGVRELVLEPRQ